MANSENVLLVTDASEVDPDALALFRETARGRRFDVAQEEKADLTMRRLVAVDPASKRIVGEIAWREVEGPMNEGGLAIVNRLVVAEGKWTEVSEALAFATAAELAGGSIDTAVIPGQINASEFRAVLEEFGIRWLYQD